MTLQISTAILSEPMQSPAWGKRRSLFTQPHSCNRLPARIAIAKPYFSRFVDTERGLVYFVEKFPPEPEADYVLYMSTYDAADPVQVNLPDVKPALGLIPDDPGW